MVKNPPAMQKTWVQSLCWEDPLEKEMATHSSILAWRIPWTEEPGGLQSMGFTNRHDRATNTLTFFHFTKCFLLEENKSYGSRRMKASAQKIGLFRNSLQMAC